MSKFKTRKKYRLTFINENTFNAVWTVRLSRAKVWALSPLTVAAIAALILWLATATPMSALLPGYLKPRQRAEHINNTLRVDSLAEVLAVNSAYLQNIAEILGGTLDSDSLTTEAEAPEVTDTLMATSDTERAFVEKWNARERYTLSVLTPLAADAMAIHPPVAGARTDTLLTTGATRTLRVIPPRGSAVTAMAAGTVIAITFNSGSGDYTVTMQHSGNLTSVISGITSTLAEQGRRLRSGEALGRTDGSPLGITLWLDGTSLDPRQMLK